MGRSPLKSLIMKCIIWFIILMLVIGLLISNWFVIKFEYAIRFSHTADEVSRILGDPVKIVEEAELGGGLVFNEKAAGVYYWNNGSQSYHFIIFDSDGDVIDYGSQGW